MPEPNFLSMHFVDCWGNPSVCCSGALLIDADHVSTRVAEPRSDFRRVRADRLHDLAAVSNDRLDSGSRIVDHNVNQKAGLRGGRPLEYPCAAYSADRIIKGGGAVATFFDAPAEDLMVEVG